MATFNDQLTRMQGLINYGMVSENTAPSKSIEYHEIAADGKSYAIIKENSHYFIKSAPADKEMVLESYEYLDGWNHLDKHEYSSYAAAKKQFGFKLSSLREAFSFNVNKDDVSSYANMELMTEGSEKMMNEIARQKQIMFNAAAILKEDSSICKCTKENPEAPKQAEGKPESSSEPFNEKATATLDKDPKASNGKPESMGEPYGEKKESEKCKDAEYVPKDAVAAAKPKGGKVVKVNEDIASDEEALNDSDEEMEVTSGDDDFVDAENNDEDDIEIVDDTEEYEDNEPLEDTDSEDEIESEEDLESEEEFGEEEDTDTIESLKAEIEELEARISELEGTTSDDEIDGEIDDDEVDVLDSEDDETIDDTDSEEEVVDGDATDDDEVELPDSEDEIESDESEEVEYDDMDKDGFMECIIKSVSKEIVNEQRKKRYMSNIVESVVSEIINEEKTVLNDFGKHPGYRKKPMELPETGSDDFKGNKDWNDDSVHNEQPFGQGKGKSDPYKDVVAAITDKVMETIKKKVK